MSNNISFDIVPKTTDLLPKHDLVFGSPVNDPIAGLPIGDGDTGSLIWMEADGIHININKTDLWDLSSLESDYLCSGIEEDLSCLRHGGELVLKWASPCLDMIYQKEFEARLSLRDATAHIHAETAFSTVHARCFASNARKVTALECTFTAQEPDAATVTLSRWGSKNFWRWYAQTIPCPEAGLSGTESEASQGRLYIRQQLNGTAFCLGVALVTDLGHAERVINQHGCKAELSAANAGKLTLYWNISSGDDPQKAQESTRLALDAAVKEGFDAMHETHCRQWETFWNKSLVGIDRDFIENCFYLSLYYSNSECRGAYPPHFTNGIWGFRHDYMPWTYYFHYNMQHMYGPLEPSGHSELAENYYAMRRRGLNAAYLYAKNMKNMPGAFYHDVTDLLGRGADYDSDNCTPGPQIAMAMYRHYRMTGDEDFLRDTALPVMKGTAEFYLGMLQKEADGLYHIHNTTAYEGTPLFHDTITDLVMIRALFGALVGHVSDEERAVYADVLRNLPGYVTVPMDEDETCDGKLTFGFGKGRDVAGDGHVLTIGFDGQGNTVRRNHGDPAKDIYGFPDTEMSPLYPAGVFGLKDKHTPMFAAMTNQVLLHHTPEGCMHWCMMPIYLARMGMGKELYGYLEDTISHWLIYPNGFSAEGPDGLRDMGSRLKYNSPINLRTGQSTKNEGYGFRRFDMETLPIIAHSVCESLLQSYEGILRVCPAADQMENVSFCLYGEGGFRVCGDLAGSEHRVTVTSLRGEPCRVSLPERMDKNKLQLFKKSADGAVTPAAPNWEDTPAETLLVLDLQAGETVLITDCPEKASASADPAQPTKEWKHCKNAHLGTPAIIS